MNVDAAVTVDALLCRFCSIVVYYNRDKLTRDSTIVVYCNRDKIGTRHIFCMCKCGKLKLYFCQSAGAFAGAFETKRKKK